MRNLKQYFILGVFLTVLTSVTARAQEKPFELNGIYVEGCSCQMVCTCSLNGEMAPGCQVMGALIISSGNYGGADLSGIKMAFAIGGGWGRIYIQSDDSAKAATAAEFGRSLMSLYGTIESIQDAKIDLAGSDGNYTLSVNDGEEILLKTKPVLGGDKKTAVTYTNYPDPLLHTIMQGKVVSGSYNDDKHHFTLKDSNSFFNQNLSASGKI